MSHLMTQNVPGFVPPVPIPVPLPCVRHTPLAHSLLVFVATVQVAPFARPALPASVPASRVLPESTSVAPVSAAVVLPVSARPASFVAVEPPPSSSSPPHAATRPAPTNETQ